MEKSIIVPWDFTEKAESSFQHSLILSSIIGKQVEIFHVVDKEKEIEEALVKLNADANRLESLYGTKPLFTCKAGDIYKTINNYCEEISAPIVVMPLHNSSRAIKVITGGKVPFYLVQEPPKTKKINDIVVPVDHYEENRVQLNWVIFLAKFFKSNINFIKPFINSNSKNILMKKNMFFVKQLMDAKNVVYGVRTSKRDVKFLTAVSRFTKEIDGDLIFMMTYNFKDFMKTVEKENCKVPILCLNPKSVKIIPDKY